MRWAGVITHAFLGVKDSNLLFITGSSESDGSQELSFGNRIDVVWSWARFWITNLKTLKRFNSPRTQTIDISINGPIYIVQKGQPSGLNTHSYFTA